MSKHRVRTQLFFLLIVFMGFSCAYYNTFYNARKSYESAMELARQNPDNPVSSENVLLESAISGAAKVLSLYPDSRWADDAQLLLGDAFLQSGRRTLTGSGTSDFIEAMKAYSSAVILTDNQMYRDRANIGIGLAATELGRFNDAIASFSSVSSGDDMLFIQSRLYLMETCLLDQKADIALKIADTLGLPGNDSLAAELTLLTGRALIQAGQTDSGAVLALSAGEMFGRGDGYYRALTVAAEARLQEKEPAEAVEILNSLLAGYRSDMETAKIALLDGKARELSDDISGAMLSYRSAADLDRYREFGAEALYRRALLLERAGRIEDALDNLEELAGRSGDYIWIRLAADRKKDLDLLKEYMDELSSSDEADRWLYRVMIAEKRMDLYGDEDTLAVSELLDISENGPDMERAISLVKLSDTLDEDSSMAMIMEAYSLSDNGDLATDIENRFNLPRGSGYQTRPSAVLEKAWELIGEMKFSEAVEVLQPLLSSTWSRMLRPEILWALYVASEAARVDDSILESYLTELVDDFPDTDYGRSAGNRLGGEEEGGGE